MARYPGNDTTRELISFAVPANVANVARRVCEENFWSISHLCRAALFRDLKERGYFNDDFSRAIAQGAGREDLPR